jgi:hypothetical protein
VSDYRLVAADVKLGKDVTIFDFVKALRETTR